MREKLGFTRYANYAWTLKAHDRLKLCASHRMRAARLSWEWHNLQGTPYLSVGVADPKVHRRWATSLTLYLPCLPGRHGSWTGHLR
ncbi:MAG: hypothetical protein ACLPYO_03850 [Mycobacterium sp.]